MVDYPSSLSYPGSLKPMPAVIEQDAGYTLYRSLIYHRAFNILLEIKLSSRMA